MKDEYPTEKELKIIQGWDLTKKPVLNLLEFIKDIWWMSDWGYRLTGKQILRLELHTGGWSGNEDIIHAMKRNFIFWSIYWKKHITGGHYYFRIDTKQIKAKI